MFRKKLVSLLTAALMIAGTSGSLWEELYVPVSAQAVTEIQEQDDHRELIELCRSYYGYNDLGRRTNGAALQSFYDALYEAFSGVWTGETDYEVYPNDSDYYVVARINYREYGITDSEAKACYYALRHDNPVMYYLANQWATGGQFYYALMNKEYSDAEYRAKLGQDIYDYILDMTSATEGIGNTRRFQKALILHDKLLPKMTYNTQDMAAIYSHNIIGAVEKGTGVCECYAKTYQMLLNYVGVDNVYVVGYGSGESHGWNAVKMDDGRYYFVDVTWDDKRDTHKYFAKGYATFGADHKVKDAVEEGAEYFYELPAEIAEGNYNCQANDPTLHNIMEQYIFVVNGDNTVTITSYKQDAAKVVIPSEILGMPVTQIGSDAFFNKTKLLEVVIPDSVTTLGFGAFFNALTNSEARKITIPASVTDIGDKAVGYKVTVGGSGYGYDGDYSLFSPALIKNFTIYCTTDSQAHKYAVDNGISYVLTDHTHTYTSKVTKQATCTQTGTRTFTCQCGDSYTEDIPKAAHTYKTKTVAATYTSEGYTLHTCSVCGASYKDSIKPKLTPRSIAKAAVSGVKNKYYTGKALKQSLTVKLGSKTLKAGTDYTLSYKNNKAVGKATVIITGKGAYTGSVSKTFKILPKKTAIKNLSSPKSKQLKATYGKVAGVTGYQISYSTSSGFKKATTKTASSAKTAKTVTVSKKGIYYVRVRTYKTVSGVKYYSGWSDVKKVRVK